MMGVSDPLMPAEILDDGLQAREVDVTDRGKEVVFNLQVDRSEDRSPPGLGGLKVGRVVDLDAKPVRAVVRVKDGALVRIMVNDNVDVVPEVEAG